MRILVSILLFIISGIFVYYNYFIDTNFASLETLINFLISVIIHMYFFIILLKLAGIKFSFTDDNDDDNDDNNDDS